MTKNRFPGKFIAFEGLDGAGKSTQTGAIINYFSTNCAAQICATYEPTQLLVGGLVRGRLLGEWQSTTECLQLLFAADRADHLEKEILPLLEGGVNVVCDRYFLSSVAYGSVDCDPDWLAWINSRFMAPDLTVYLDVPAQICVERMRANGRSIELFEKVEILEKVGQNYRTAMERFKNDMDLVIIDGNRSLAAVTADAVNLINAKIFNFNLPAGLPPK